jgi:1,4-alpha-glucan branching enzyme
VDDQLDWALEGFPSHDGVRHLVRDLNRVYREEEALHILDHQSQGFEWIECNDPDQVILAFVRWAPEWRDFVLVLVNLTPVPRPGYRLGVPWEGRYELLLNSDAPVYGGGGMIVPGEFETTPGTLHGREHVLDVPLPGLSVLVLKPRRG